MRAMRHLSLVLTSSLVAVGLTAGLTAGCGSASERRPEATEVSAAEARKLLTSTPWLDHLPSAENDPIDLMQLERGGNGVYVRGNQYRGSYEVFRFEATEEELRLTFLDNGGKAKTRYRIERMKRGGFDLRMTLSASPRGPSVYYGFEPSRQLPAAVAERAAQAQARAAK
jgi:hypothetical protein